MDMDKESVETRIAMHMRGEMPPGGFFLSEVMEAKRRNEYHRLISALDVLRGQADKQNAAIAGTREKLRKQEARLAAKKTQMGDVCIKLMQHVSLRSSADRA
jgi:BMFP domain-containing protein YqiC